MRGITPYRQNYWDWRAAGNFMYGGAGSGLIMGSPLALAYGEPTVLHLLIGLAFMATGLGLVWLEIGRPFRALNVFLHPQRSWMTREGFVATVAFGVGAAAIWFGHPLLIAATAALALLFLYCQARILTASKGIPAWREPTLPPLIVTTGLLEGAALSLALISAAFTMTMVVLVVLLTQRAWCWRRYRLASETAMPAATARVLAAFSMPFLVLGHALPLALLIADMALGNRYPVLAYIAAALAFGSGWAFKFMLVRYAAQTQGFAIVHRPARGPRGSGGAGVKPGWGAPS